MQILRIAAIAAGCTLALAVQAEGLEIKPGRWETTTTMKNPFTGETTETTTECIEETEFDPASMMKDAEGCELTRNEVDGNRLEFAMECDMEGARSTMNGVFESEGDSGSGSMDMTVNAGGMNMDMSMNWTSRRLGDC